MKNGSEKGEGVGEGEGEGEGEGGGKGEVEGEGEGEGEEKRKKAKMERERAREKVREEEREKAKERAKKVKMERRATTRRVAIIFGASQPTLALGRQTSNCHVGQDWCGRLTSGSSWLHSSGTARCLSASSGKLPSEHWTES